MNSGDVTREDGKLIIDLAALRETYDLDTLLENDAPESPDVLFDAWMALAVLSKLPEPQAMTLATVGSDLQPSTRVVLLKAHEENSLVWFTNYQSRKAVELAGNPKAALQFHWVSMQRVVRIEGLVQKVSEQESDTYYHSRPLDSRIGAWASPQSRRLPERSALEQAVEKYKTETDLEEGPARPPFWGGFRLIPQSWEFWQGRPDRLHDRLLYTRQSDGWELSRLAP